MAATGKVMPKGLSKKGAKPHEIFSESKQKEFLPPEGYQERERLNLLKLGVLGKIGGKEFDFETSAFPRSQWAPVERSKEPVIDESARRFGYSTLLAEADVEAKKNASNEQFAEDFRQWLQGYGGLTTDERGESFYLDQDAPPHYRNNSRNSAQQSYLRLPGVQDYFDTFIDRKIQFERKLTHLIQYGPYDLNSAWFYYKYVIRGVEAPVDEQIKFLENYLPNVGGGGGQVYDDDESETDDIADDEQNTEEKPKPEPRRSNRLAEKRVLRQEKAREKAIAAQEKQRRRDEKTRQMQAFSNTMNSVLAQQKRLAGNSVRHQDRLNEISRMLEPTSSRPLPASSSDASDKQAQKDDDISGHLNTINDTIGTLSDRLSQVEYSKGAKDQEASAVKEAMKDFFEKLKTKESTDAQSQLSAQFQHIIERIDNLERLHKDQDKDKEGGTTSVPTPSEYRKLWQNEIRDVIEGIRANESEKAAREKEAMLSRHSQQMEQLSQTHATILKKIQDQQANKDRAVEKLLESLHAQSEQYRKSTNDVAAQTRELLKATHKRWSEQISALESQYTQASGKVISDIATLNVGEAKAMIQQFSPEEQNQVIAEAVSSAFDAKWQPFVRDQFSSLDALLQDEKKLRLKVESDLVEQNTVFTGIVERLNSTINQNLIDQKASNELITNANLALEARAKQQAELAIQSENLIELQREGYRDEFLQLLGMKDNPKSIGDRFLELTNQVKSYDLRIQDYTENIQFQTASALLQMQAQMQSELRRIESEAAEQVNRLAILPPDEIDNKLKRLENRLIQLHSETTKPSTALADPRNIETQAKVSVLMEHAKKTNEMLQNLQIASKTQKDAEIIRLEREMDQLKQAMAKSQRTVEIISFEQNDIRQKVEQAKQEHLLHGPAAASSNDVPQRLTDDYPLLTFNGDNTTAPQWPQVNFDLPTLDLNGIWDEIPDSQITLMQPIDRKYWKYFGRGLQARVTPVEAINRLADLYQKNIFTDAESQEISKRLFQYADTFKSKNGNFTILENDVGTITETTRDAYNSRASLPERLDFKSNTNAVGNNTENDYLTVFDSMSGTDPDSVEERKAWLSQLSDFDARSTTPGNMELMEREHRAEEFAERLERWRWMRQYAAKNNRPDIIAELEGERVTSNQVNQVKQVMLNAPPQTKADKQVASQMQTMLNERAPKSIIKEYVSNMKPANGTKFYNELAALILQTKKPVPSSSFSTNLIDHQRMVAT